MMVRSLLASIVFHMPNLGVFGVLAIAVGLVAAVLAYLFGLRDRPNDHQTRYGLLSLRLFAIICLLLSLAHPSCINENVGLEKPLMAVIVDDSLSMEALIGDGDTTRYEYAVDYLDDMLLPTLTDTHRVALFDVQARKLDGTTPSSKPSAAQSPLTESIVQIQRTLSRQELAGIVLLSDGREITREQNATAESVSVPVYAPRLCAADNADSVPDLSIESIAAGRRVIVGNTVRVVVDIAAKGNVSKSAIPLSVSSSGNVVGSTTAHIQPSEAGMRATLEFTPTHPGEYVYTVQLGAAPGETNTTNNRATFPLTVRAKALTVFYIDGVLRWEGKFTREALSSDPDLNLVSIIRAVPPGTDQGSQGALNADQLENADLIILGDLEATFFSASELDALREWVVDVGGALVVTGGYNSFGPAGYGRTTLRDILPIEFSASANPQIERPFNLKLTQAGRQHPIFQLTGDAVKDTAFYQSLPALDGCAQIAGIKPGAQVLAVNPLVTGPTGLAEMPIIVTQNVGKGKTLTMTIDSTWRWRMVVGGFTGNSSFYTRFWGQLVRALVGYDDEVTHPLRITANSSRFEVGDTIQFDVVFQPPTDANTTVNNYQITAVATADDGRVITIPLAQQATDRFKGTIAARHPGRFDINVSAIPTAGDAGVMMFTDAVEIQVEHPNREQFDRRYDAQWLSQICQRTGGTTFEPQQTKQWADTLSAKSVETKHAASTNARGDLWLGALALALLCSEWIIRRWRQLA